MTWLLWFAVSLAAAPLLPGIINQVKAFFAGRQGPPVFQLYIDLAKLLRKEPVISTSSGGLVVLAPVLSLACFFAAALFIPHGMTASPVSFPGDIILFFYLLGTARMATVLAALDTASAFEGMGASREMQFSALVEAAIFGLIGFMVFLTGQISFNMLHTTCSISPAHIVSVLFAAAAFFIVLLAENCRVPVDDPDTHLELTMIHEAMILDASGPDLAFILYGSALKLWLFAATLVMILLPPDLFGGGPAASLAVLACIFFTAVLIGIVESCMARYRFLKVPQLLIGALAVSLLGILFLRFAEEGHI